MLRAITRLIYFLGTTAVFIAGFAVHRLFIRNKFDAGIRWRTNLLTTVFHGVGLEVRLKGEEKLRAGRTIYIANHRSYIDPALALLYARGAIVAKAELASWPLIGYGMSLGAVVFVKRSDKESRGAALETMRGILRNNYPVLVFPEGTTSKAPDLLPFRLGAFRLAAEENCPVIPMAIEFEDPDDAWIGDDKFIPHFFKTFSRKKIVVHVSIGDPMQHDDPETLSAMAFSWMSNELKILDQWVQKES